MTSAKLLVLSMVDGIGLLATKGSKVMVTT